MVWFGLFIIVISLVVFVTAVEKVKYDELDELSWWLTSLGIYQWGQGLVLAFFWILFGLACLFWWTPSQAMMAYILFHIVRAVLEVCMIMQGDYNGLSAATLFHHPKISAHQRMRLYCLSQGLIILIGLLILSLLSIK